MSADCEARYSAAVKYGRAVVMIGVIVGDLGHADRLCDAVTGCNKLLYSIHLPLFHNLLTVMSRLHTAKKTDRLSNHKKLILFHEKFSTDSLKY